MTYPSISIVIPTYNSERFILMCIKAINEQVYPKNKVEILVADNGSKDNTAKIARKLGAKVLIQKGLAPQVCQQRNLGAAHATGDYIYILDHDMELPKDFLKNFAKQVENTKKKVDAWYVSERIICHSNIMKKIRNFESECVKNSVVAAARIIKKSIFNKTEKYDTTLSGGPADWDMDIQLKLIGARLRTLEGFIYHHEESLTFWQYIGKKGGYVKGIELYQSKWSQKDKKMYNSIVKKQFNASYRLFGIFFEKGKWVYTLKNFPIYILMSFVTILKGLRYLKNR